MIVTTHIAIVCPKLFLCHIWTILITRKNAHTCKKSTIRIDKRKKNIEDIFIDTLSCLLGNNRNENIFLTETITGNVETFSPFGGHLECLAQFFDVIIRVLFNATILYTSLFLDMYCNLISYRVAFQMRNLGNFLYF